MFRQSFGFISRIAIAPALLVAAMSTSAFALQSPATGLGESWPNATDVSTSPHYHVYVFVRDGIRYIQVNDLNGTVRSAVAVADRVVLVLPVGVDAQYVSTAQNNAQTQSAGETSTGETIYSDGSMTVLATPDSNGSTHVKVLAQSVCTDPFNCAGTNVTGAPKK